MARIYSSCLLTAGFFFAENTSWLEDLEIDRRIILKGILDKLAEIM
jgi:hypothetical protein